MNRILQLAIDVIMPFWRLAAEKNSSDAAVTRISVLMTGKILLGAKEATVSDVKRALDRAKTERGVVWYYRESGKGEPPPEAIEVFNLIVENKVPIILSSKPDFSDYIDEKGLSHPRK
ncbi:MAG: hypothetical protein ACREQ2_16950 [Candidatus Binatia bacterium]